MSRQKAEVLGCVYWSDFFKGTRGNHWRIEPTKAMIEGVDIYQLERTPCLRDEDGIAHGWAAKETCQVLFDVEYVQAWKNKYKKLLDVLSLNSTETTQPIKDMFYGFEQSTGLVVSLKNPRQSTYLKFKEYCNDRSN